MARDEPDSSGVESIQAYRDAADRLERTIDIQVEFLEGIDDKAEHLMRLCGILLGLVFTILTVLIQIGPGRIGEISIPVQLTFLLGIFSVVLAMILAGIAYLSSQLRIGLHHVTGTYLGTSSTEPDYEIHLRRIVGLYGTILAYNEKALGKNSNRFRVSMATLFTGVVFLSLSGILYVGEIPTAYSLLLILKGFVVSIILIWYIIGKKYMLDQPY